MQEMLCCKLFGMDLNINHVKDILRLSKKKLPYLQRVSIRIVVAQNIQQKIKQKKLGLTNQFLSGAGLEAKVGAWKRKPVLKLFLDGSTKK